MSLIDIDSLKQYIGDCKFCEKCPNNGRNYYECYYDCKFPDYLTKEWERVLDEQPIIEAIPVEHVEKMIEIVKSLPDVDYFFKYFAVNVMDALISGWRAEQGKQNDNN